MEPKLFFLWFARICSKLKIVDFFARFFSWKNFFGHLFLSFLKIPDTFFVLKNTRFTKTLNLCCQIMSGYIFPGYHICFQRYSVRGLYIFKISCVWILKHPSHSFIQILFILCLQKHRYNTLFFIVLHLFINIISLHDHSTISSYDKGRPIGRKLAPDIIHNSVIIDDILTHIENFAINVFLNHYFNLFYSAIQKSVIYPFFIIHFLSLQQLSLRFHTYES